MKKTLTLLFFAFLLMTQTSNAQFWKSTGALEQSGSNYLVAAANVGDAVYASTNTKAFVYSTDKGVTWNTQNAELPAGNVWGLFGTPDRLYAQFKINSYDMELYYTMDHGATWVIDTAGLPQNIANTGKDYMYYANMGDNYIIAYMASKIYYKQLGGSTWLPITNFVGGGMISVTYIGKKWVAIAEKKIVESNDHGATWNEINTTGLPSPFQGLIIVSNHIDRLYLSPVSNFGGVDIYFSTDGGNSWSLTNSAGHFEHNNPWVGQMYAVDDYLFASINPNSSVFDQPPPYLISSSEQPNFEVGDTTGLQRNVTTSYLPFFFHIDGKLFTMIWDLYSSEPGFTGLNTTSIVKADLIDAGIYPNPTNESFRININKPTKWTLRNLEGKTLKSGTAQYNDLVSVTELAAGVYIVLLESESETRAMKLVKQ